MAVCASWCCLIILCTCLCGLKCETDHANTGKDSTDAQQANNKNEMENKDTGIHTNKHNQLTDSNPGSFASDADSVKAPLSNNNDNNKHESDNGDSEDDSGKDINRKRKAQMLVFEETGEAEEFLVDQIQRLSEKVKTGQGRDVELQQHREENGDDSGTSEHLTDTGKLPSDTGSDHGTLLDVSKDMESNIHDKISETHGLKSEHYRGTILEQMKEYERKVTEGQIPIQEEIPNYADEDSAFPTKDLYPPETSKEPSVLLSSELNVHPSLTDMHPINTEAFHEHSLSLSTLNQFAQKLSVQTTPTLDILKPSTVKSFSKTVHDIIIQPTSTVPADPSAESFISQDKKSQLQNHHQSQSLMILEAHDANTQIDSSMTQESVTKTEYGVHSTSVTSVLQQSEIVGSLSMVDVNHKSEASLDSLYRDSVQYGSTVLAHSGSEHIENSKNEPTEMHMYETSTEKQSLTVVAETAEDKLVEATERFVKNPTDSSVEQTDSKVQPLTETALPEGLTPRAPTTESKESEEETQRKEKAQKYFEEGEKLVNNSYKKDHLQAYEYFQLAADLGHSKAWEYLGFGHLLGDYVKLDPAKALHIFQDLSDIGSPKGQLGLGFSYSSGLAMNSSQAKALIFFTFSALGGDPLAQMVLGYRYLSGIGVEAKCETALLYYRKVATTVAENTSSGSPVVQRIRLHEQADNKDNGASLMDDDLLQYYEFLADKGDIQAQVVLGQLYYQGGRGVPVNHERAQHFFLMAAESGNPNALAFLGKMHSEGSPVIVQDTAIALQYFKKAADKNNPIGLFGIGMMHLYGKGVEKDYQKAFQYISQSADNGWSDAQLHLGIMYFSGKGVKRDYKSAVRYFNLASQGGHVLAFYHLAQMHATGTGVLRNCHTAVEDHPAGCSSSQAEWSSQTAEISNMSWSLQTSGGHCEHQQLYKNVAERGPWSSMLMEAHDLYKKGHVDEALLKYIFVAELGYEVAQTNVAYILDQGESNFFDKETYQRALLHWGRAASQGSALARLKIGDYHYYGYGTAIDYESAATHYRLATEQQHNAQAMFNLGYMHENGLGLKQDIHLAKRFYDMAAETSAEAYIPVSLALLKLGLFYGTEVFNKEMEDVYNAINKLDIRYQLGPNWDIYLATFLAIVLGILVVIVRHQRL